MGKNTVLQFYIGYQGKFHWGDDIDEDLKEVGEWAGIPGRGNRPWEIIWKTVGERWPLEIKSGVRWSYFYDHWFRGRMSMLGSGRLGPASMANPILSFS